MTVDVRGIRGRACGLLDIAELRRDRVGEAAVEDVRFSDRIGRRGFDRRTRFNVLEHALRKRYACDLLEGDRLCFIIDIGCGDLERDRLAELVLLVIDFLRNNQIGIDRIVARLCAVSDRQHAVLGRDDHIVARRILGSIFQIHHESVAVDHSKRDARECNVIFADQRAAAVCRDAIERQTDDLIVFQIHYLISSDFMQLTVVDLRVAVRNELDLHRPDDQRTVDVLDVVVRRYGDFAVLHDCAARFDPVCIRTGVRLSSVEDNAA